MNSFITALIISGPAISIPRKRINLSTARLPDLLIRAAVSLKGRFLTDTF